MTTDLIPSDQLLFGSVGNPPDPIASDGVVPKKVWVSPNGTDGDANGRQSAPFKTITFALSKLSTVGGGVVYLGPGSYAEDVVIPAPNVSIIGTGGRHTGTAQIIGSGAVATNYATVYVGSTNVAGFRLANVELDTNGIAQAGLRIDSNDTGAAPSATSGYYRFLVENVAIRSNDPACGVLLSGATLGDFKRLLVNGPTVGIGFTGSANNTPSDLLFEKVTFYNGFSGTQTACVGTVQGYGTNQMSTIGAAVGALANIVFDDVKFLDPGTGAGGGTNYINLASTITCTNVAFVECRFATAPTNGTNKIATLPTNVLVLGHGTSGLVSLKG